VALAAARIKLLHFAAQTDLDKKETSAAAAVVAAPIIAD
jgi:hypothetical protein